MRPPRTSRFFSYSNAPSRPHRIPPRRPPPGDLAADFKTRHRLSLADAFAAALAKDRKTALLTADPEFKPLEHEIKINWLQ